MPRVPALDNVSVLPGVGPTPQARMLDAPQVQDYGSRQMGAQAQALGQAANVATGIAADMTAQANRSRLDDAQNRLMAAATDLEVKARQLRGRNALERPDGKALPDEFGEQLDTAAKAIEDTLGNEFQRQAFRSVTSQLQTRFRGSLSTHMAAEQRTFDTDTAKGTIEVAVDRAIKLAGDEAARQESLGAIDASIANLARLNGWDEASTTAERLKARSAVHSGLIGQMIAGGRSGEARAYYDANSAEMTVQARTTILPRIQEANDAQAGDGAAGSVWSELGPKTSNDAVRIADMEQQIRERLAGNPNAIRAGIDGLRQRAQAHNAQQAEMKAQSIAGVWALIPPGGSITPQVMQSQAWLGLSDTERRQIRREVEAEQATRASRAAAEANRALADRQRELTGMQINDRLALMQNQGEYLRATDPERLSQMSRAQVEAMRGTFGFEATQHLLSRWDTLQKPGKLAEARIDTEDFNLVADQIGLKPFDPKKSEDERRALGSLKYRVEQLIDTRQRQTGKTMERDEKMRLMRDEMARTVTVDRGIFSFERQVPVIALTPNDVKAVQVPAGDRKLIEDALRARGQPVTDDAVRRLYLRGASPAADSILPQ